MLTDEAEPFKFILNRYCARSMLVSKEANLGHNVTSALFTLLRHSCMYAFFQKI